MDNALSGPVKQLNAELGAFLQNLESLIAVFQSHQSALSDGATSQQPSSLADAQGQVMALQRQFAEVMGAIAAASLNGQQAQQLRVCQTEAHRRLRLLGVEAMRLNTAKQPDTLTKLLTTVTGHLEEIQKFAQQMATVVSHLQSP